MLVAKLQKVRGGVEDRVNQAVAQVGEDLLGKAIPVTPLEHGPLRRSGYVEHSPGEAVVGFAYSALLLEWESLLSVPYVAGVGLRRGGRRPASIKDLGFQFPI